jgi:DNA-directed RNA polymerase subunit F
LHTSSSNTRIPIGFYSIANNNPNNNRRLKLEHCAVVALRSVQYLFLDQIAANLVVKVLDMHPGNLLTLVLVLFSLESELDEDLLQFLVDVVDAKLFEAIVLSSEQPEINS